MGEQEPGRGGGEFGADSQRARSPRRVALAVGEVVRGTPYRLVRWLGDGGMGAVFEAEHVDTERRLAVKVLHAQRLRVDWVVQGFRNEARASARIGSPNIVDIYDFKELDDGRLLIAMEFLDGPTLHDEIVGGALAWSRLVAIGRQICKGLAAAHEAEIIHRDIKPENIMVVHRERREDFVKILDFGVAHFTRDGSTDHRGGASRYSAPESSEQQSDPRTDIYAVGCLLYELATGVPPFEAETSSALIIEQRSGPPQPPSRRGREVPVAFDELVMQCLAVEPDDRVATMVELEAALCELQIQQGWATAWDDLPAPEVEAARRARIDEGLRELSGRSRGSRWPTLLLAGALLTAAAAVAVVAWPREESSEKQDLLEQHSQAAQHAAARFYFVYPPLSDPKGMTAYRELLALEALDHESAQARGQQLREDFAGTLIRLGDRYWDFDGARPFAYEYYASALIFMEDDRARARTGLSPVALERLRARAASADFSEHELTVTESLVALAEPDADARVEKLEALASQGSVPISMAASIERVLDNDEHRPLRVAWAGSSERSPEPPDESATAADVDEPDEGTTGEGSSDGVSTDDTGSSLTDEGADDRATGGAGSDEPTSREPRRDPSGSKALVSRAQRAQSRGDRRGAEALFNQALELDSRNKGALDGLASIAFSKADYTQSAKYLERAVKLDSKSPKRWLSLGDAYFKTVRYSKARRAYERAQQLGSSAATGRLEKLEKKMSGGG